MRTPKQLAAQKRNLKPFAKGVSGNPSGKPAKPKPLTLGESHKRALLTVDPETGESHATAIARHIVETAITGDATAIMRALDLDSENLIKKAVTKLAAEEGVSKAQARAALALFCPPALEVS